MLKLFLSAGLFSVWLEIPASALWDAAYCFMLFYLILFLSSSA